MRLARHATLALFAASLLAACGTPRDVDEDRIGARNHDVPFGDAHATGALADMASCTRCHAADEGGGAACTACHDEQLGFADWATNCSFCHGTRTPGLTGAPGPLAAPPHGVAGAGDQTSANPKVGAHAAHLEGGTYSSALPCSSCHAVPAQTYPESLAHVDGSAAVQFSALARQDVTSPAYAGAGGSCDVYCHGSTAVLGNRQSPAWTSTTPLACDSCHPAAPASGEHTTHLTRGVPCARCHPGYAVDPAAVDLATHVNGVFEASPVTTTATFSAWPADCGSCHSGVHDLPFLDPHPTAAVAAIASCKGCHGDDYGGGAGQSCTACHDAELGFADWRTNCTFCHGTRTTGVTGAPGALAAPPQSVAGTGDQTSANPKVGAHVAHLAGGTYSSALACSSCHAVPAQTFPASLAHVDGSADVEFSTTARKNVTNPAYAGAGGSCDVYCHGSTAVLGNRQSPAWTSTAPLACDSCHSSTPTSGEHTMHRVEKGVACARCHPGYAVDPAAVNLATHVNGTFEASPVTTTATFSAWPAGCGACHPGFHAVPYLAHPTAAVAAIASCKSCHGTDYRGGIAQSCTACHDAELGFADWATNCSFCHGTRTAGLTGAPGALAAPPQSVAGTGDQTSANPKVGAHAAHLVGGTYSNALACSSCHAVPAQTFPASLAHLDGSADVEFSTTAQAGVTSPAYAGGGGTCNVYCHGSTALLGNKKSPAWTSTAPLTCDSCHSSAPTSGRHTTHLNLGMWCGDCHPGYRVGTNPLVDLPKHVNGKADATQPWTGCNCH